MRLNKSRQKLLMVSTVPLAVAALLAGVLPASASVSQAAARGVKVEHAEGCIKLNLIDRITNFYTNANVPPSSVSVGFKSAHFDQLYDSTGSTVVGSAVGTVDITNQLPSGDVIEYLADQLQFPEGTLLAAGAYNHTSVVAQQWQSGRIKGTSGRYQGMRGVFNWRILTLTALGTSVQENIVLCH
jgi:hypothetical protein